MGLFCLVLHTHLPYVRRNGVWPSGEDFFHQAATESYLPLLGTLQRLADAGARDALTISLSPMIAHQMQDPHMLRELGWFLGNIEVRALQQVANYDGAFREEFRDLAAFYARFGRAQADLLDQLEPSIADGFARLERAGVIELLGGPATHPFLPRITEPSLAEHQVRLGLAEHRRIVGARPSGMWLPECAYKPDAGIEELLEANGVDHVVVDGPTMLAAAGPGATFRPRTIGESSVVAFARNLDVTYRVWSPTGGYPTGRWYRDFHHYDIEGGFKDWRVTSIRKPVERKRPYEPDRALAAARADAEDFAALVARTLAENDPDGVVVAAYDTELFGHWWFEGPTFLEHLFLTLRDTPGVEAASLARARSVLGEPEAVALGEGSWGFRKDDRSWVSDETEHLWKTLADVEADTVRALARHAESGGVRRAALAQMLREAMLLQASDWPFMVIRGRNPDYARERFESHRARWAECLDLVRGDEPDDVVARAADALFETDNILPEVDALLTP